MEIMSVASMDYGSFRFIAHRGAPKRAPENTLASFQAAYELGAQEIETDVQMTGDGIAVLCHDDTLARYGHGERTVGNSAYYGEQGLSSLDFGSWFSSEFSGERMATLSDLLSLYQENFIFHIELKDNHPQLAREVLRQIREQSLTERCVLTSFSCEQLRRARESSHDIRLGWLVYALDENSWCVAEELKLFQLCPLASSVTADLVTRSLEVVQEVRAWGCPRNVAGAQQMAKTLKLAGCTGMTVDELTWFRGHEAS